LDLFSTFDTRDRCRLYPRLSFVQVAAALFPLLPTRLRFVVYWRTMDVFIARSSVRYVARGGFRKLSRCSSAPCPSNYQVGPQIGRNPRLSPIEYSVRIFHKMKHQAIQKQLITMKWRDHFRFCLGKEKALRVIFKFEWVHSSSPGMKKICGQGGPSIPLQINKSVSIRAG